MSDCCKIVAMGNTPIPLGVVVTASGTGSEQNNGAVITDEEEKVKGAIADSTIITPGCCKQLTADEIVVILNECK